MYPSISTYIMTSWGYQGSNGFYLNYFEPIKVVVPDYFGSYSQYSKKFKIYTNLTIPKITIITNNNSKITISGNNYKHIQINSINIQNCSFSNDTKKLYEKYNYKIYFIGQIYYKW
ncbi:hypothetical protein Metvu_0400 [Methanocaldococcus vulcanius M7]|uniref:Uncharacterized protein n=1 Tax=Methanocaldococcus vulcanius (strain ATCC 700851 / DSM 12094 / M7) TaxID=579137 RepID=C9RFA9_METVM|nr:hypothetical protein Metvu_0400 [Methanocaldococcus vulcanius M7]